MQGYSTYFTSRLLTGFGRQTKKDCAYSHSQEKTGAETWEFLASFLHQADNNQCPMKSIKSYLNSDFRFIFYKLPL
jgi:hypothetical protein